MQWAAVLGIGFLFSGSVQLVQAQISQSQHVEDDLEWSRQMALEPAFVVDQSRLRVPQLNELNTLGQWSEVIDWPHTPVSAANLPDGRLLTYSSNAEDSWPAGQAEFTYAAAWDPVSGEFKMVPHNTHDMFCAELVLTDKGKVHVTGGRNSVPTTSLFDATTESWEVVDGMSIGRWYPTSVSLPNGEVFTALGSGGTPSGGPIPEVWNEDTGWYTKDGINLTNPIINQQGWTASSWPYLFMAPNGELFHAGPTQQMHYINLGGDGSVREAGSADKGWYGKRAINVMYEENKIMIIGGSVSYESAEKQIATNQVVSIDISGDTPALTSIAPMIHPRVTHNGVLLPNGEILVVGGRTDGGEINSVLTPEIWNPDTGAWTTLADMSVPRNYHSTALMLPDGRVWSGGGGFCSNECAATTHSDAQVFSPPYLFNADGSLATRPVITTSPASIVNGSTFTLDATPGLTRFTAIKMSAITHQMNTDLRRLYVEFTETTAGSYALEAHQNPNVLTPGYWMFFGVDSNGVPSEAAIIQVTSDGVPVITNPGIQFSSEGELITLPIDVIDDDPLTFSATGLPTGLSINSGTGEITGVLATGSAGTYAVEVTVNDGTSTQIIAFPWEVSITQGEIGSVTVDQPDSGTWHAVALNNSYIDPVVVMGPPSFNGDNPVTIRVRNVTATGFEFQLDEWDYLDGTHGSETMSYMVVEAGSHMLLDGRRIAAGVTELTQTFSTISYGQAFDNPPVVFSQIGSVNEATAASTRQRTVTVSSFEAQIEEEEGSDNVHAQETVYWVAIDNGASTDGMANEAGVTADVVEEQFHSIAFSQAYDAAPVFLAAMQTADGGDTAVLRYQNLTASGVDVKVEEEQSANDEVGHTNEVVGYMVFNQPGDLPFEGFEIPPIVLTNPGDQSGVEGEAISVAINVEQDNGLPLTFTASGLPAGVHINAATGQLGGGLVAGTAGTASVTVEVNDGASSGAVSFTWSISAAAGTWLDFNDDSGSISLSSVANDDGDEKDIAVGDLDKDGWDDIIVVRKEGFMGTGARADLLLMNESGTLVDRTADLAPGFAAEPTIARDAIITDLDGDGWDDVLIANTF
ncbi:MAG: putative Ig domain-containing protein, partial [Bacteroidota bacterium]